MPVNGYWQFGEVVAELEISPSTLRQWSEEFVSFLSSPPGEGDSRLYTEEDLVVLATVKDLLAEGLTSEQVAEYLKKARQGEKEIEQGVEIKGEIEKEEGLYPLTAREAPGVLAAEAITKMLQTLSENQQAILNSQQANRDLLGVVIQDNFNLKEENARLRDRMLRLEQELAEIKRKENERRETLEARLRELERELEEAKISRVQEEKKGCLSALFGIF